MGSPVHVQNVQVHNRCSHAMYLGYRTRIEFGTLGAHVNSRKGKFSIFRRLRFAGKTAPYTACEHTSRSNLSVARTLLGGISERTGH